jgi:hypothetical protein
VSGGADDFAVVDHDRAERCGFPEVVLCQGKEPAQVVAIAAEILSRSPRVLLTRAAPAHAAAMLERWPAAKHHQRARCLTMDPTPLPRQGLVAVIAAGTADLPVAEEAVVTLEILGARVETHWDIGAEDPARARGGGGGRDGRRAAVGGGRAAAAAGDRGADQRRLRRELRGDRAAAHHARLLRGRRGRGQH